MSNREHTPPHAKLPSLHEVLGDVLDRPASRTTLRDREPSSQQRRSGHQHPAPSPPHRASSTTPYPFYASHPSSTHSSAQPIPQAPAGAPGHTFHLFHLVPNEGLVHQRSSARDDLDSTMPKPRLPPQDPARKYVCSECGNRFLKQSTLKTYRRTTPPMPTSRMRPPFQPGVQHATSHAHPHLCQRIRAPAAAPARRPVDISFVKSGVHRQQQRGQRADDGERVLSLGLWDGRDEIFLGLHCVLLGFFFSSLLVGLGRNKQLGYCAWGHIILIEFP
ncbi:hypothetical protein M422DRAFT_265373 [Sphaerobolus stellatus SS14]|uniref:C2H2-type domain-containing protein n=1 Tax=Sphaerobolus stellatus (strain SS14) TaxID=990650 RepID=A0A0C9TRA9_SPHS4|nr:hypothetical protein M422DRAFT_265373 [Sphaerobolus stellatus SS14]